MEVAGQSSLSDKCPSQSLQTLFLSRETQELALGGEISVFCWRAQMSFDNFVGFDPLFCCVE
jgi:hypothetical protein